MSEELEDIIKSLPLKEPSGSLDSRIEEILKQEPKAEAESEEIPEVKPFPWQKVVMYSVAALLFMSIGIAELVKRSGSSDAPVEIVDNPPVNDGKAVDTFTVSTKQSEGKVLRGNVIELEDGTLVRPMIRQIIIRKTYFDKEKNVQVEVEEPQNEIYYIPLDSE